MFVVLSTGINKLGEAFTLAISAYIKFWNLILMFLNLMDFTISSSSFSNASSSLICAGQFLETEGFFITFDHITTHEKMCVQSHMFNGTFNSIGKF